MVLVTQLSGSGPSMTLASIPSTTKKKKVKIKQSLNPA
jgi:Tfp pilus assembly pilus retraction ATPase PilT